MKNYRIPVKCTAQINNEKYFCVSVQHLGHISAKMLFGFSLVCTFNRAYCILSGNPIWDRSQIGNIAFFFFFSSLFLLPSRIQSQTSISFVVCLITQWCLTLCDPMVYRLPGSSVHGILQARILEWVVISFSRGSS